MDLVTEVETIQTTLEKAHENTLVSSDDEEVQLLQVFLPVPEEKAMLLAKFPPGCPVTIYHFKKPVELNLGGTVVEVGTASEDSAKFEVLVYKIHVEQVTPSLHSMNKKFIVAEEQELCFAKGSPVWFTTKLGFRERAVVVAVVPPCPGVHSASYSIETTSSLFKVHEGVGHEQLQFRHSQNDHLAPANKGQLSSSIAACEARGQPTQVDGPSLRVSGAFSTTEASARPHYYHAGANPAAGYSTQPHAQQPRLTYGVLYRLRPYLLGHPGNPHHGLSPDQYFNVVVKEPHHHRWYASLSQRPPERPARHQNHGCTPLLGKRNSSIYEDGQPDAHSQNIWRPKPHGGSS